MSKRVASIILNRNLPTITNKLVEHLKNTIIKKLDIYVVEAGSDKKIYLNILLGMQIGKRLCKKV